VINELIGRLIVSCHSSNFTVKHDVYRVLPSNQ